MCFNWILSPLVLGRGGGVEGGGVGHIGNITAIALSVCRLLTSGMGGFVTNSTVDFFRISSFFGMWLDTLGLDVPLLFMLRLYTSSVLFRISQRAWRAGDVSMEHALSVFFFSGLLILWLATPANFTASGNRSQLSMLLIRKKFQGRHLSFKIMLLRNFCAR